MKCKNTGEDYSLSITHTNKNVQFRDGQGNLIATVEVEAALNDNGQATNLFFLTFNPDREAMVTKNCAQGREATEITQTIKI